VNFTLGRFKTKDWFRKLPAGQRDLLTQSLFLFDDMGLHKRKFYDYSFIVMPAAKAYEGFVKEFFYKLKLISEKKYRGDRFRVGKALNPELEHIKRLKKAALYQDLTNIFGSSEVPARLWQTWKECRNRLFHFFPELAQAISFSEAEERLTQIFETIEFVYGEYEKLSGDSPSL
jgi:hypothetical protein